MIYAANKLTQSLTLTRITLRPPELFDLNNYHRCYNDQEAMQYYKHGFSPTLDDTKKKLLDSINHWKKHGYGDWTIIDSANNKFIGFCGFDCEIIPGVPNLGFAIIRDFWNQGFATEAAVAAIRYAFEELKFNEIIAFVHPDNQGSIAVLTKCKMKFCNKIVKSGFQRLQYILKSKDFLELNHFKE